MNHWKNTSDVISWFKNINNKKQGKSKLSLFDINNFYLRISEISNKIEIGLCRDGGFSIFRQKSGIQLVKKLQILFKEYDLEVTTEINIKL